MTLRVSASFHSRKLITEGFLNGEGQRGPQGAFSVSGFEASFSIPNFWPANPSNPLLRFAGRGASADGERGGLLFPDDGSLVAGVEGTVSDGLIHQYSIWGQPDNDPLETFQWVSYTDKEDLHWFASFGYSTLKSENLKFGELVIHLTASTGPVHAPKSTVVVPGIDVDLGKTEITLDRGWSTHYPGFFTQGPA